jgi:hypothetical protein
MAARRQASDTAPAVPRRRASKLAESRSGELGARRLFARVRDEGSRGHDLPTRLAAGLRAALGMLSDDPGLARLLTVDPYLGGDEAALSAQQEWIARFAGLLRRAAADDPRTTTPDLRFLAVFLIGGIRFQIARLVLNGEDADLLRLLPGLLEVLLAYYFEPAESRRLAGVALQSLRAA